MSEVRVQGRLLSAEDLDFIRSLLKQRVVVHRSGLSRHLCEVWNWRSPSGQLKDIAARSMLRKLERRGLLVLPPRRTRKLSAPSAPKVPSVAPPELDGSDAHEAITGLLPELRPLRVELVTTREERAHAFEVLRAHHYLGFNRSVGENIGYRVYDHLNRLLAVAWFGAAAWKVADRDRYIGWTPSQREQGLSGIANNVRFLILPWVRVNHLASHILGQIGRRIGHDWQGKYGHPVVLLETFIEEDRFRGTSYLAANWKIIGRTTGRSRQDRNHQLSVARKRIALLPLKRDWQRKLLNDLSQ